MQNDLISRSALIGRQKQLSAIEWNKKAAPVSWADAYESFIEELEEAPAVDAVPRSVFEQIKWERDCAMQQLKDHGIPFGGIAPAVDAVALEILEGKMLKAVMQKQDGTVVEFLPVVRCKDCVWGIVSARDPLIKWCNKHATHFRDNDFCSYGERRENDGK